MISENIIIAILALVGTVASATISAYATISSARTTGKGSPSRLVLTIAIVLGSVVGLFIGIVFGGWIIQRVEEPKNSSAMDRTTIDGENKNVSTPTFVPVPNLQKIAYVSNQDGNEDIYITSFSLDDFRVRDTIKLTTDKNGDYSPVWSPDGNRIAFVSDRDGDNDIYVMNADGTGQTNITNNQANDGVPSWSPDGRFIAFQSNRDNNWEIYVIALDSGDIRNLTDNASNDTYPDWSPDGNFIAFVSDRERKIDIYVVDISNNNLRNVTDNVSPDYGPSWSPDSRYLAFISETNNNRDIYVTNIYNNITTRLTTTPIYQEGVPNWSPDGKWLVFQVDYKPADIRIISSDGTKVTTLISETSNDYWPSWSPN